MSDNAVRIDATGIDCEKLLLTLKAHYADMIQRWIVTPTDEMTYKLGVFKNITHAVIAMRRAEILKVRLEIEHAKLELLQQKLGDKSASSASAPAEANGRGAGVGAGGCPGEGGGPGESRASFSAESAATSRPKPKDESTNRKSAPAPAEPLSDPPAHRPPPPEAASPDSTDPSTWELEPLVRRPASPPMPDRKRTFHRVLG